jgi:uncharacterized membrane protein YidH (DUF202 family)
VIDGAAGWRRPSVGKREQATRYNQGATMYIGIGTVVVILALIILFMLLRGRRV